jgi:hypothetical protein
VTKLVRGSILIVAASGFLTLMLSNVASQETVTIEKVPGQRIDAQWYRYLNARFGFGVDLPATGFSYELSANGDGVTLTSANSEKSIAVYGSQDIELNTADSNPLAAFATVAEEQVDAMRLGGVNIVHERIEPLWFELSTTDVEFLYYQKGLLSPECPTFTTNLWIKYPNTDAKEFDSVAQRMSTSLVGNCSTVE